MESTLLTLLDQFPIVRLVGSVLGFHLAHMSSLLIVTGLTCSSRVFPSGLATFGNRHHMV